LRETGPLRDKVELQNQQIGHLQKELESKDSQLKSVKSYNTQIRAELQQNIQQREELESSQREIQRLRKELTTK
jgi:predicted RNase H-like nuclease (RuvC/YqgF family)